MPLYKPTFQPFFPDPDAPFPVACGTENCYPVAAGDIVRQQWRQTPCSGSIIEDPGFDNETLGAEMITEGDFPCPAAAWTYGTNWSCASNAATYSGLSTSPLLSQSGIGLAAGNVYRVSFDVVTVGSGGAFVTLGSGAGSISSSAVTTVGTHVFYMVYNDTDDIISFQPAQLATFISIDNVSVKQVTYTNWVTSGSWALTAADGNTPAMACKNETGTGKLYNGAVDYFVSGDYYVVTVHVSNYGGDGTLTVYIDDGTGAVSTNAQTAISANGTYTYYITASQAGVIGFAPSNLFTGCISLISAKRLRNDYIFNLINEAGDVLDVSVGATYVEDKIFLNLDFSEMLEAGDVEYGCYTISIYDACIVSGDNILTDGDFANQDYTEWVRNMAAHQYNYTGTGVEFILEPLEGANLVTNGDFSAGSAGWTGFGADWTIVAGAAQHTPGNTTPITQSITMGAIPPFPSSLFTWYEIDISGRTAGTVTVSIGGVNYTARFSNDTIADKLVFAITGAQTFAITPTSTFDGTIDNIQVHQTQNVWENFPQLGHVPTAELVAGNYNVDYEITSNVQDGVTGIQVQLDYNNPSQLDLTTAVHSDTFNNYIPTLQRLRLSGSFKTTEGYYKLGRIAIDDVSLYAVEPFEATFESECLNFQDTHTGTTLVTGWCDQDALGSNPDDDLMFATASYLLQMRVRVRSMNAFLPTEGINAFFGDGSAAVKYAQIEKYWQLTTDYISESALTAMAAMVRCDHFTVGEEGEDATEYLAQMGDFNPDWIQSGSYDYAPVTVNVRTKTGGMKFNRHK